VKHHQHARAAIYIAMSNLGVFVNGQGRRRDGLASLRNRTSNAVKTAINDTRFPHEGSSGVLVVRMDAQMLTTRLAVSRPCDRVVGTDHSRLELPALLDDLHG
jgi:hypothetical protein